jgi:hypothetical protein
LAITSIAPVTGTTLGGTVVTLTGTGFATGATVAFGGAAATGVVITDATSANVTTPAHAAGAVDVVVAQGGQSVTLAAGFTYVTPVYPAPTLASITPAFGPLAGGGAVTLTGTGFRAGATVTFGGAAATAVVIGSATSITCTTPAHAAGLIDVVVTNSDAKSGTKTGGYEYAAAPTLAALSPTSGPIAGGTVVTLTGTGLRAGATVSFGGVAATAVNVASATSATCTAPAHAAGTVDVVLTNVDAQAATKAGGFLYIGAPAITSVSPGSGGLGGGTTTVITGSGFNALTTVTFGSAAATSTLVDSTHLLAKSPAGTGRVAVSVQNPGFAAASEAAAFNYVKPASEVIVLVNGTVGQGHGGILVFDPAASGAVPPNGDSIFAKASGDLTKLVAPGRAFVRPGGLLYSLNTYPANDGALLSFAWQAGASSPGIGAWPGGHRAGNTPPVNAVTNPAAGTPILRQPTALAWDGTAGQVIVGSYLSGDVVWIAENANGVVAPTRTLNTRGGGLSGVAFDDRTNDLYLLNANTGTIDVYDESASSTAATKRVITIAGYNPDIAHGGDYAVDLLLNGDELFVQLTSSIQVFPRLGSGTLSPLRKIAGGSVGFTAASGLGYDLASNELYVADRGAGTAGVYVFDAGATGNIAPKRTLAGAATDISDPIGVYINHDPHDCAAGPALASASVSLWWDAACGKTIRTTSAGMVSWVDRKAGVALSATGGVATFEYDLDLGLPAVLTDGTVNLTRGAVPGTVVAPSDNLSLFSVFKNVPQGSPATFTNGVVFAFEPDGETGDDPHVRLHAPYADGQIYFDSGPGSTGRIAGPAPGNFGNSWNDVVAQRSGASALFARYPSTTAANVYASSSALAGATDPSKPGTLNLMQGIPGGVTELIVTTGATSAADTATIGGYLSLKWSFNN